MLFRSRHGGYLFSIAYLFCGTNIVASGIFTALYVSTSINTQMDALIPPSKISGLTQGMFVGSVSDNFNERIEQKIFHCEIVVDAEKVKREESAYKKIPVITNFTDEDGNDRMKETVQANYRRIKEEVKQIVQEEQIGRASCRERVYVLV